MAQTELTTSQSVQLWAVPWPRNPFFTGRARALNDLHAALKASNTVALTDAKAFGGLGGSGKTETALAYVYRYRESYDMVFWLRGDSEWTFTQDLLAIARRLGLATERRERWHRSIRAMLGWLSRHEHWLAIIDNINKPKRLMEWLPAAETGHVLVTSSNQSPSALGVRHIVELEPLTEEEAVRFLFKRTGRLDNDTLERKAASQLAEALMGYPFALEQAGAFLAAERQGFREYLARLTSLSERRDASRSHDEAMKGVARSTCVIAIQRVAQEWRAAAELLRASAFLYLDRIPRELLTKASQEFGPDLSPVLSQAAVNIQSFTELVEPLTRYGLARQDQDVRCYSIHHLVRHSVQTDLHPERQREWADRNVRALQSAYPLPSVETDQVSEETLLQAHVSYKLVEEGLVAGLEIGRLLKHLGSSIEPQAGFTRVEKLYTKALTILDTALGATHPEVAEVMHQLACGYAERSKYSKAEELFKRALTIREQAFGTTHPEVAASLHGLACVYMDQGAYQEAEDLFGRAREVAEDTLSSDDPRLRTYFNSLARFYHARKKYDEAEILYRRALSNADDSEHPELAAILNNLAGLYHQKGQYASAEPLLKRSLVLAKKIGLPDHPDLAVCLNNLAALYFALRKYTKAEPLYEEALAIRERHLPPNHPDLLTTLDNYAMLLRKLKRSREATELEERAKTIRAK